MTIIEAINYIDSTKPNNYSPTEKLRWLSRLDARIKEELIDTHEDAEITETPVYDDDTPLNTVLIAHHPYDEIYPMWLEAQIDYANGEYTKYNNSMAMFNYSYSSYERWYNRNHMPLGAKVSFFTDTKKKKGRACPKCGETTIEIKVVDCSNCMENIQCEDPLNQMS